MTRIMPDRLWVIAAILLAAVGILGCNSSSSPEEQTTPPGDTTPPAVVSATATDVDRIEVVFSEELDKASAETAASYKLTTSNGADNVAVETAALQTDLMTVVLTTEPMTVFVDYTLEVTGVADAKGNGISVAAKKPIVDKIRTGRIYTIAGTGRSVLGADNVDPLKSDLYQPQDVTVDPKRNLIYILDWNNHRVRVIENGIIRTICGTGIIGDADPGPGSEVGLNHPTGVAIGPDGNIYIAAWHNSKILRYNPSDGYVDIVACWTGIRGFAGDGGPAYDAIINLPSSVAFGPDGNLYLSDQANFCVRMIRMSDMIISTPVAKRHRKGFCGDGGPAVDACLWAPSGQSAVPAARLTFDQLGNLYLADTTNQRVRKVDTDGIITTVAGNGVAGYSGDGGAATAAQLFGPSDVACHPVTQELYIADTGNDVIRKVDADGVITTVVGIPRGRGTSPDGTKATEAKLNRPFGITFNTDGDLYIADTLNHIVRIVYQP